MSLIKKGRDILVKFPMLIGITTVVFNKTIGFNRIRIKGKSNKVSGINSSFLRRCKIKIIGDNNLIIMKEMSYLNECKISIYGNNNEITIGNGTHIAKGDFYIEDDNNAINVGDLTAICGYTHIAATEGKRIVIGKDCLFSSDVIIRTGDSHSIIDLEGHRINQAKDVIIGNHVWIGNRVTILKGSKIKSNSVVGTGSIVTKAIDIDNAIITGNPAYVIKQNINWDKKRI